MFATVKISKSRAESILSEKSILSPRGRKILKTDLVYLPVFMFTIVSEDDKGKKYEEVVSVDGLKGEFAYLKNLEFENFPEEAKIISGFTVSESDALKIAENEYRRTLYKSNLKTPKNISLKSINLERKFHYPYWIGYYKHKKALDFSVIDAISGSRQGVKMIPVFIEMLLLDNRQQTLK